MRGSSPRRESAKTKELEMHTPGHFTLLSLEASPGGKVCFVARGHGMRRTDDTNWAYGETSRMILAPIAQHRRYFRMLGLLRRLGGVLNAQEIRSFLPRIEPLLQKISA